MGAWIEIRKLTVIISFFAVAPPVGAWIEIVCTSHLCSIMVVAPPVGAWIEILRAVWCNMFVKSLPPWERGLK